MGLDETLPLRKPGVNGSQHEGNQACSGPTVGSAKRLEGPYSGYSPVTVCLRGDDKTENSDILKVRFPERRWTLVLQLVCERRSNGYVTPEEVAMVKGLPSCNELRPIEVFKIFKTTGGILGHPPGDRPRNKVVPTNVTSRKGAYLGKDTKRGIADAKRIRHQMRCLELEGRQKWGPRAAEVGEEERERGKTRYNGI